MLPCPRITGAVEEGSQPIVQVSFQLHPGAQALPAPSLGTEGCSAVLLDADRSRPVLISINGVLGVLWDPGFTLKRSSAAPGETLHGFQPNFPLCQARLLLPAQPHYCSSGLDTKGVSGICSGISFRILKTPHLSSNVEVIK